jgi:hypothetical protein
MTDFNPERAAIAPYAHLMNLVQVGAYDEREPGGTPVGRIEGVARAPGPAWSGGLE